MGCQQSIPTDDLSSLNLSASVRPKKPLATPGVKFQDGKQPASPPSTASVRTARTAFSSSTVSVGVDEDVSYVLPKVDYNGHLLMEEIVKRTSSSLENSSLSIGEGKKKFELEYAYRSQRGYDPQEPLKANQEKHDIQLNFASEGGDALIGVYSGHGEKGKQCANICETMLPKQLGKFIRQKRVQLYSSKLKAEGKMKQGAWNPKMWPILPPAEYEQCCKRAIQETKTILQQQQDIKEKLSGTSALTVSFHGGTMYVTSVGGCGAILGRRDSTELDREEEEEEKEIGSTSFTTEGERTVIPLNDDHTLNCSEELERVKLSGAEVKESDEDECRTVLFGKKDEQEKEKPLRVFYPGESCPATKFTRSICDSSLESIGIIAEPSVTSCNLTSKDDILIIGSNAVFAFLTNQEIMNIGAACHDPLQASEAITKAAYEKWIEHTNRCEDLTVIVCFLSNFYKPPRRIRMPSDVQSVMADDDDDHDEFVMADSDDDDEDEEDDDAKEKEDDDDAKEEGEDDDAKEDVSSISS